jgi:hypothetical protein
MILGKTRPVLRIFDRRLAKSFYLDWLAFHLDWEFCPTDGGPAIAEVSRDHVTLHLSEHYGDGSPGAKLFISVDNVEALHRELTQRPNSYMKPAIEIKDYGAKVLALFDPFGNRLIFSQAVPSVTERSRYHQAQDQHRS